MQQNLPMQKNAKIYIAGHRGLVGSAIVRQLHNQGYHNLLTATHTQLDLVDQGKVNHFFSVHKPDYVFLAAAKVGGIYANNTYPAEFIYQNLMIQANIIHAAYQNQVKRLLFLGSSCIYPRAVKQPMREDALLTDVLEPTNEPYAIAKIAGIKLCESYNRQYHTDFRSAMPTNLYGKEDNFHAQNAHVIPALIRRFYEATTKKYDKVVIWGSGTPRREFLHVDDMAAACVFLMNLDYRIWQANTQPMCSHINIGTGEDCTIAQLARLIQQISGFTGEIVFDTTKPDGTPRKLMDVSRINAMGWRPSIDLQQGLEQTYAWYSSCQAAEITHQEERSNSTASAAATKISGQAD